VEKGAHGELGGTHFHMKCETAKSKLFVREFQCIHKATGLIAKFHIQHDDA
jgi:hypothetical protein